MRQALKVLDSKVDTVMSGLANLKLAALPPVDAVVRTAAPTAEAIVERYQQAHDALVAAPIYLRCVEKNLSLRLRGAGSGGGAYLLCFECGVIG